MASKPTNNCQLITVPENVQENKILHWRVKRCQIVNPSICVCQLSDSSKALLDIRAPGYGRITLKAKEGEVVTAGSLLFLFSPCSHHIVMKDLCAECGANLRREGGSSGERISETIANIPMVHAIPELHVSESVADEIALQDQQSLLAARKLVLLVDLDQTVLHTTNDPRAFVYKDLIRYRLPGSPLVYHTRFRPHLQEVLEHLSHLYQMHICTFGNRVYAHQLAALIDPKRRYFSQRILSRDECFNPVTKSANLRALFPRGLNLVCIIDDRGEVWDWSPNLILVKPYRFFPNIGDINAFPWSTDPSQFTRSSTDMSTATMIPKTIDTTNAITTNSGNTIIDNNQNESDDISNYESVHTTGQNQQPPSADTEHSCKLTTTSETTDNTSIKEGSYHTSLKLNVSVRDPKSSVDNNATIKCDCENENPLKSIEDRLDSADDDYLLRLQNVLIKIHENYFKAYESWQLTRHQKRSFEKVDNFDSDNSSSSPSIASSTSSNIVASSVRAPPPPPSDDTCLPHVSNVIAKVRASVLGPQCVVTLSGLSSARLPADMCMAGRIVRSLGAVLQPKLKLPLISKEVLKQSVDSGKYLHGDVDVYQPKSNALNVFAGRSPNASSNENICNNNHNNTLHYTTHLIACRRDTEKVHTALKFINSNKSENFFLLSPHWIWSCYFNWTHMPENLFPLKQDFHASDFDPSVQPVPGTARYSRTNRYNSRRYHHRHSRHNLNHLHKSVEKSKTGNPATPNLDTSIVQSTLDSVNEDLSNKRKRKREHNFRIHYLTKQNRVGQCGTSLHVTNSGTNEAENNGTHNGDVDVDGEHIFPDQILHELCDNLKTITGQRSLISSTTEEVVNADESDDSFSENEDVDMVGENTGTEVNCQSKQRVPLNLTSSDNIPDELSAYLPPPRPLVLADNPLLHLPPDATGQMLAEIEDAVLEEETELANLLPRETEIYDPASSSVGLTDSSSSSTSSCELTWRQSVDCKSSRKTSHRRLRYRHYSGMTELMAGTTTQKSPNEKEILNWQVQRELLVRRRHRASPTDLAKIDKKLRRIDIYLRRDQRIIRECLADNKLYHKYGYRYSSRNSSSESDSSDTELYDADYPKGWSPTEQARDKLKPRYSHTHSSYRFCRRNRSTSPTVHSDPEPNEDWWRLDDGGYDSKEWNTCPEGYDYEDAEQTRELLYNRGRDRYDEELERKVNASVVTDGVVYDKSPMGRGQLTNALFDTFDDDDDEGRHTSEHSNSNGDDEDYEDIEDDADECWNPLREFM